MAAGPCGVGAALLLPGSSGGPRRCGAAVAGREHRRRGRAEHREVQDRGPALETETAGGTRLAGRGRARAVYAAPPRCPRCLTPTVRGWTDGLFFLGSKVQAKSGP